VACFVFISLYVSTASFAADELPAKQTTEDPWARFVSDIGPSFGALFSWDNALPATGIGVATAASSLADEEVQEYFGRADRFGAASDVVSHAALLTAAYGTVIAVGFFSENPRLRLASADLALGFIVNNTVTFAIKVAVRRERPDGGNFSFPSGHASNVFTAAAVLDHHYGPKVGIPVYLFATFVSLSRMDLDSHWLSDTVAGAGLGILVGRSIVRRHKPSRVSWVPLISKDTIGLQVFVRL
jgi:membrane-associated phospholipid phosphatase